MFYILLLYYSNFIVCLILEHDSKIAAVTEQNTEVKRDLDKIKQGYQGKMTEEGKDY